MMAAALVISVTTAATAQQGWSRYSNPRFGYAIDVPAGFSKDRAPANSDGLKFLDTHGATLRAWGSNNVEHLDPTSGLKQVLDAKGAAVTYKAKGKNWFVVSWRDKGKIHYEKDFLGEGAVNAFRFTYPATGGRPYTSMVTRLEQSFKPGDLTQAH
ncbi:MAG: hypothetical protein EB084_16300 [Proteobacteria bacterium]|nr:hypothetical protein [Pseudomonadota bacterium]